MSAAEERSLRARRFLGLVRIPRDITALDEQLAEEQCVDETYEMLDEADIPMRVRGSYESIRAFRDLEEVVSPLEFGELPCEIFQRHDVGDIDGEMREEISALIDAQDARHPTRDNRLCEVNGCGYVRAFAREGRCEAHYIALVRDRKLAKADAERAAEMDREREARIEIQRREELEERRIERERRARVERENQVRRETEQRRISPASLVTYEGRRTAEETYRAGIFAKQPIRLLAYMDGDRVTRLEIHPGSAPPEFMALRADDHHKLFELGRQWLVSHGWNLSCEKTYLLLNGRQYREWWATRPVGA